MIILNINYNKNDYASRMAMKVSRASMTAVKKLPAARWIKNFV
jgi:hypothetical protein